MADDASGRPLLDKLGVRAGARVCVLGPHDESFVAALHARGADVSLRRRAHADTIFLFCERPRDLARIAAVMPDLERDGALWVIRPKGSDTPVSEQASMRAGLDAGLVDVKVVSFSQTHSALKFVYRLRDR